VENKDVRILVVDDEPTMADSLRQNFLEEGYVVDTAATGAAAIELFDQGGHHLAICDLQLPDMDGLEVMRHMKDARPTTEVIVVTGYGSVQKAVEATKAGAFYFVEKPFDFEELQPLVEKALERRELVAETTNMRRQLSTRAEYFNIIGASKPMQTIYETIESVAKSDANVLIVGESGTGKELIANAIHYNSLRSKKPFIKVNCAALPKELIESELFGHTKGAFTGAHADKEGLVQHAAGGSLMLDEIAEMSLSAQVRLLRVLQNGEFARVGGNEIVKTDVRVIAASNVDLEEAVREGRFRRDLFYRLNVYPIKLPPLRERIEDIPLLATHFLEIYKKRSNKNITGITKKALEWLRRFEWPGNVRELENAMERAAIIAQGRMITVDDLPHAVRGAEGSKTIEVEVGATIEEAEKRMILQTLAYTRGDRSRAAQILGIGRKTLYRKLQKYYSEDNA